MARASREKAETMSQLGDQLRTARESQGISLSQAAIETRILQRYLVALEDGDYQHLPGDVYARGFIRNYADYLGMPSEELIELYRHERGGTEPIRVVPAASSPRIRGCFIPSFFGVFFVVLALIGVSYLVLTLTNQPFLHEDTTLVDVPALTSVPTPLPLPSPLPASPDATEIIADAPKPQPTDQAPIPQGVAGGVVPTPLPPPTPTPSAPIVGEVRVASGSNPGSWMRVTIDGQTKFEGILKPGEAQPFTGERNVQIRVGNAGVVFVTINGQDQSPIGGPIGQSGQVMTINWPPQ